MPLPGVCNSHFRYCALLQISFVLSEMGTKEGASCVLLRTGLVRCLLKGSSAVRPIGGFWLCTARWIADWGVLCAVCRGIPRLQCHTEPCCIPSRHMRKCVAQSRIRVFWVLWPCSIRRWLLRSQPDRGPERILCVFFVSLAQVLVALVTYNITEKK